MTTRLWELAWLFFRIGATGFGGPAVLIAMMEDEVVARRKWLTREHFLDLVGATNIIPGPNAVEMAIHIGFMRAGWPGLAVAGAAFLIPATAITTLLAWAYVRFGSLPAVQPFLVGVKPAVLAVIIAALWRMGRSAAKGWRLVVVGLAVTVASVLGVNEILALFAGGLLGMCWLRFEASRRDRAPSGGTAGFVFPAMGHWLKASGVALAAATGTVAAVPITLSRLFLYFLKTGSVLYGSGYVLVAFIERGLVHDYGWLTQKQLLDAIAAGQFTPGPFSSTATFVGYMLLGLPGALLATLGMFLPSFVFVAILNPFIPRLRKWAWTASFLDAVNVASVGLMAAVALSLAQTTLKGWPAWGIALVAGVLGVRFKLSATWLVLGGALVGWVLTRLFGMAAFQMGLAL